MRLTAIAITNLSVLAGALLVFIPMLDKQLYKSNQRSNLPASLGTDLPLGMRF